MSNDVDNLLIVVGHTGRTNDEFCLDLEQAIHGQAIPPKRLVFGREACFWYLLGFAFRGVARGTQRVFFPHVVGPAFGGAARPFWQNA
jgi:hypothetical protein